MCRDGGEFVEVVKASALQAERAHSRGLEAALRKDAGKLREAIHSALGYISVDIGTDEDEQAYRICQELREALAGVPVEGRDGQEAASRMIDMPHPPRDKTDYHEPAHSPEGGEDG